jgi:serine/threonine-protein kinase
VAKDPPSKPSVPPAPRSVPVPRSIPPATPRSTRPLPVRPTKLGKFDVLAKIAGGGMASIYLGRSTDPDREMVALKVMRSDRAEEDEQLVKMFVDEANVLARLHHPAIVRTIEVGVDGGQRYIAMELLLGMTLMSIYNACTSRGLRLEPELVAWIGARLAEGLHHAHELRDDAGNLAELIHRDVNPANVFVTFEGNIKLFDFGMAKTMMRTTAKTAPGVVKGKLSYLAPEHIMQLPLDRRVDIFGLATTLWEMCTMQRLFQRDTDVETVRAVHVGKIPDVRTIVPEVPARLAAIVHRGLERNRDHRYPNAEELAKDLDAIAAPRAANAPARLSSMLDSLFPDERKKQRGWLKPALALSSPPPAMTPGGSKVPPAPTSSNKVIPSVVPSAPTIPPAAPSSRPVLPKPKG